MSEIDKALQALTANQKMIERMTWNSFSSIVNQQREMFNAATESLYFLKAFSDQYTIPPGTQAVLERYAKMSKTISSSIDYHGVTARTADIIASPIAEISKTMSVFSQQEFLSAIAPAFSSIRPSRERIRLNEPIESHSSEIDAPTHSFNDTYEYNDYITVDESVIKEICIPDNLVIPIGNYRVKIKTDLFISIMGVIISAIITLVTSSISSSTAHNEQEQISCEKAQSNALEWGNDILYKIFDSMDTSNSSKTDVIGQLQEILLATPDTAEAPIESAGSHPQPDDNTYKSDDSEPIK